MFNEIVFIKDKLNTVGYQDMLRDAYFSAW